MSIEHNLFRYSITCKTNDLAVLHCLRALCQFAEKHKRPQIGWGGTGESKWRADSGQFILRFTKPEYREQFIEEANRLFSDYWTLISIHDNDSASPQR
jgi:hypothetical protein